MAKRIITPGTAAKVGEKEVNSARSLKQNGQSRGLTGEQKHQMAENSIAAFWPLYEKLNHLGYHFAEVSEQKLDRLQQKDKIDLNTEFIRSSWSDKKITIRDFFNSHNAQTRKIFTIDEDFKRKLHAPMLREAQKRKLC